MDDILTRKFSSSEHAVESRVGEETVLLHLESGTYYGLSPVGTRIWELLNDGVASSAICAAITEEYDVGPDTVENDLRRFLEDLADHAILVEA